MNNWSGQVVFKSTSLTCPVMEKVDVQSLGRASECHIGNMTLTLCPGRAGKQLVWASGFHIYVSAFSSNGKKQEPQKSFIMLSREYHFDIFRCEIIS